MAAYIDLNPVRAGICENPEDYRWSSYGEAIGAGRGGAWARAGLVRGLRGHEGQVAEAQVWSDAGVAVEYRRFLVSAGVEGAVDRPDRLGPDGKPLRVVVKNGRKREEAEEELEKLNAAESRDLKISKVVRCRVRYFTDGMVLGSRKFVDNLFLLRRGHFGSKRKDGARKPRGALNELKGEIWAMRDLLQSP